MVSVEAWLAWERQGICVHSGPLEVQGAKKGGARRKKGDPESKIQVIVVRDLLKDGYWVAFTGCVNQI